MANHRRRFTAVAFLAFALSGLGACDGDTGAAPLIVSSVSVTPGDTTLQAGETARLRAVARDASGAAMPGLEVTWSIGSADVATVSAGLISAIGAGTTEVTASIQGVQGRATLHVEDAFPAPGPVHTVALDRTATTLKEGDTTTLIATARDADGTVVEGGIVQWTTSNVSVAPVGFFGGVTGVKVGTAQITARVDGVTASAEVTVTADYGYDLIYDLSEAPGAAPVLFRLSIGEADADPVRIVPGRQAMDAAVSPAGDRIAFLVYGANGGSELWVANPDGSDSLRVAGAPGWHLEDPSWASDGSRIAYHAWSAESPVSEIWVVDADGTDAVSLTTDQEGATESPAWSPERIGGERIAYTRILDGKAHLWTMRPDGSDKTQVTIGNVADVSPTWSPDGQRLAFERYTDTPGGDGDIWLVGAEGAGLFRLTNLPLGQFSPAWSPDGKLVAFSSGFSSTLQIYTIWTDGTKLAQRTMGDRPHERPAWIFR